MSHAMERQWIERARGLAVDDDQTLLCEGMKRGETHSAVGGR